MIVPAAGMADAYDGVDYYLVLRDKDDQWSEPVNMGKDINHDNPGGWSPYISPDGKYFFFMAKRTKEIEEADWNYQNLNSLYNSPENGNADIYWVDAGLIDKLKEKVAGD